VASITERINEKTGAKTYQVQIRRKGYPAISKNFPTKRKAENYAISIEAKVLNNEAINPSEANKWTIPDLIDWYIENPNPHRRLSTRKHFQRLDFLKEEFKKFTVLTLSAKVLSKWIIKRLEINQPSTVYHYYVALKNAMIHHSVQHGYSQNIFQVVKCPNRSGERNRRFSRDETRVLFKSIKELSQVKQREMKVSVLFALETGCRIGEMLKLKWEQVNLDERYVEFLAETTKTRTYRKVPITSVAKKILQWIKRHHNPEGKLDKRVFEFWHLNEHHLSRQFHICCERAGIKDVRWHDLRHEATTRFFEFVHPVKKTSLSVMDVATITGHKSVDMLKKYTHIKNSSITEKLW
jgi:integrase